jgi:antitoxin (DNA-binding transcriptional repressor) of toxin-antitoxin stability system
MTKITASELARNLSKVLDRLEFGGEEIIILRNDHPIARLIPGSAFRTALEAMADLHRTLTDEAAKGWVAESRLPGTIDAEARDPWGT